MSANNLVRLVERAPVPVGGTQGLADWALEWLAALEAGEYGEIRSLIVVVETQTGDLATISQATGVLDTARLVGLLTLAAHRKADGGANIESLLR